MGSMEEFKFKYLQGLVKFFDNNFLDRKYIR